MSDEAPRLERAPDVLGVLLGVRQWAWLDGRLASIRSATPDMRRPSQIPPGKALKWEPDEPFVKARHHNLTTRMPDHPVEVAPQAYCVCGLYAYYRLGMIDKNTLRNGVWGVVEAWGHIEEHEIGFRAQYMRPIAIIKFHRWSEAASQTYGLPLVEFSKASVWMREHEGTFLEEGGAWPEKPWD